MGQNGEEKRNRKKEVTRAARSAVLRYFRRIERRSPIFTRSTETNWKTVVSGITVAYGEHLNVNITVDVTASVRDSCASLALKSQATR